MTNSPRFFLKIYEDGKIVLNFKDTDDWLQMVLWRAFKLKFLKGMKYNSNDFDFLRTCIVKMLRSAEKHYHKNSEGEFCLKAASGNLGELQEIMYKMVGEIAEEIQL